MSTSTLVKEYNANKKQIEILSTIGHSIQHDTNETIQKIHSEHWNNKQEIDNIRDKKLGEIKIIFDAKLQANNDKVVDNMTLIKKVDRIIDYLKLYANRDKDIEIKDGNVTQGKWDQDKYFKWFDGYFYEDGLLKIKICIAENNKPKNKYSIIAYGKSIFHRGIIEFPYSYGVHLSDDFNGLCLKQNIHKDCPELVDQISWYEKYKRDILKDWLEKYQTIKAEYFHVIGKYKINDFVTIIERDKQ